MFQDVLQETEDPERPVSVLLRVVLTILMIVLVPLLLAVVLLAPVFLLLVSVQVLFMAGRGYQVGLEIRRYWCVIPGMITERLVEINMAVVLLLKTQVGEVATTWRRVMDNTSMVPWTTSL